MAKPVKQEITVKRAREILGLFVNEYSKFFEPTAEELEAMRILAA